MIRKYLLVFVVLLVMVGGVQANTRLDFQNPSDFIAQIQCDTVGVPPTARVCNWTHNTTGGNSYIDVWHSSGAYWSFAENSQPAPMQYAAATYYISDPPSATMYDAAGIFQGILNANSSTTIYGNRLEVKVVGGTATLYNDSVAVDTVVGLTQNPSTITWGADNGGLAHGLVDDMIFGSAQPLLDTAQDKYIFGFPEDGNFYLAKDLLNPAASGFYKVNTTDPSSPILIDSYKFSSTYSKGNGNNETLILNDYGGGTYGLKYTGTRYAENVYWNLTEFFATTAPYGLYATTIPGSVTYSERLPYIGNGASINFDRDTYAVGETATVTVVVSDTYYDLATYSYHVVIQDVYGVEASDQPISFSASPHTGTVSYTWLSTDGNGVYYGLIYAHKLSDGTEILMNYDMAELTSDLIVNGYVFNAENATAISGATVNITQGITTDSVLSGVNGTYTSHSAFVASAPTTIVASKTGYETYTHTFTPLYAGAIQINLTLMPTNPTYTGIALGGIVRTPPYNRTVDSATVTINKTGIGHYTVTTNSVGYYIQNSMPNGTIWDIWGSKTGFSNSTIYQKLVVGI